MSRNPAQRARAKYAQYCREIGKPLHITEEERVELQQHLRRLHGLGMSAEQIAQAAPKSIVETAVRRALEGETKRPHRDTYNILMATEFVTPVGLRAGSRMNPIGVQRRLQGLHAIGFTWTVVGPMLGVSLQAVHQMAVGRSETYSTTHLRVAALYDKLEVANPEDHGVTKWGVARAKGAALRHGYVPAYCWTPDTIDDPDAIPEWTGRCGTYLGARIHRRENIPMCEACSEFPDNPRLPGFNAGKFRALREKRGWARKTLADAVGINESSLIFWEQGRSTPQREYKIDAILAVLDADFEDVCDPVEEE